MHFHISWSDEDQQILIVDTSGLWNAMDVAAQWRDVIAHTPTYIIWDLTSVIFVSDSYSLPEQGTEREAAISQLADFIRQPEFQQFFIMENTQHPVYDMMRYSIKSYGANENVRWVSSISSALNIIQGEKS